MLFALSPAVGVNEKKEAITMLSQFTNTMEYLRALREALVEKNLIDILCDGEARAGVKKAAVRALIIMHSSALVFGLEGISLAY